MEEEKVNSKNRLNVIPLLVLGVIFAFLILETLLRSYYFLGEKQLLGFTPARTTLRWRSDSLVGTRLVEDQAGWFVTPSKEYFSDIEVNKAGWRDTLHTLEKPENVYRIIIIGDSFVENFQVGLEHTFFKQLEKNLNSNQEFISSIDSKKVEVIAMGLGDTGTAQQYLLLREYGVRYHPDFVIHMFFSGNDVRNNSLELMGDSHRAYAVLEDDELVFQEFEQSRENPIKKFAKDHIRSVELALKMRAHYLALRQSGTLYQDNYPVDYHIYDANYADDYVKAWEVTKALIKESSMLRNENGAKYLLVASANNEQVHQDLQEELLSKYPAMSWAAVDFEKPDKVLREFCEKEGLDCAFMLPSFQEYKENNPEEVTHYRYDGHWNEIGTNLTADFLYNTILSLTLKNSEGTQPTF